MSKRSSVFASVWLALWTLAAFVALTQFWLIPEDGPMAQKALWLALVLLFGIAWILTLRRVLRGFARGNLSQDRDV